MFEENFANSWADSGVGLVYDPGRDYVRYAHQSEPNATIYDVDYPPPHTVLGDIQFSALNPGWPSTLDNRTGIGYDATLDTYFSADYNGDLTNYDDNIIEFTFDGTILNAWETGDALASNDSYDGSVIEGIIDIAVVPGTPTRYFATAVGDASIVYEIHLIKTGTWWTPATWGTLATWPVPILGENLGIDYDADHGVLYHSDEDSNYIVVTDLDGNMLELLACSGPSGYSTGVTYIEGKPDREVWVTDQSSNTTTRCLDAPPPPCAPFPIFSDDFEGGFGYWTMTGLWNAENEADACGSLVAPFPSSSNAAYYGQDGICTYDTGAATTGELEMNADLDLSNAVTATLNFGSYEVTECGGDCGYDNRYVEVSTDSGATWDTIGEGNVEGTWYPPSFDLGLFLGGALRVRFRFDSIDSIGNAYFGWMVDNVEVVACLPDVGFIAGHVYDAVTMDPIEAARVTGYRGAGGEWGDLADATGEYSITALPGTFSVEAEHPMYTTAYTTGIDVQLGATSPVDFYLAPRGRLFGYVTDYDNGFPLEAAVEILGEGTLNTDPATGYYEIYLDAGTYNVEATAPDYSPDSASVNISAGMDTQQDFALMAEVSFVPSPLHVTVPWQSTYSLDATLLNRLANVYSFEFIEVPGGFAPSMPTSIPASDGQFPRGDAPVSIGRAPIDPVPGGVRLSIPPVIQGIPAYSTEVTNGFHTMFELDLPGILPNLGPFAPIDFPGAGEYVEGYIYVADIANNLYQLDPVTGAVLSTIPITAPPGGETYSGFALDPTSGLLYASSTNVGTSSLHTVDVTTGVATLVGSITGSACNIAIAIDGSGQMYGYDICTDDFWAIDKSTGVGTMIGPIGFDANFGQGMAWDPFTDQIYLAAFNNGTFRPELRVADRATGNTVLAGPLGAIDPGGLVQLPWLGIPFVIDIPWFGQDPGAGTIPADDTFTATMFFTATADAGVDQPGDYFCNLKVDGSPEVTVRVTMTVLPSASMGQVAGYVTDNCTGQPRWAAITITGGIPITQTTSDPSSGYYSAWLEAGTYNLDFAAPGYLPYADSVTIIAGETTELDVGLVPDRPCISVEPDRLEVWVLEGTAQYAHPTGLDVINGGNQDLDYAILEVNGGYTPEGVHIPPSNGDFARGDAPVSIGRAPIEPLDGGVPLFAPLQILGTAAYATEATNGFHTMFELEAAGVLPNLGPFLPVDFPGAGEYVDGYIYVADAANNLYQLDPATGAVLSTIPITPPPGGETYSGMALDPTTGILYASSTSVGTSSLFTVDVTAGLATLVGPITGSDCNIAIAIDGTGQMYGYDICTDDFWAIDKSTGAGTVIGPIGFDANFGQGMTWDPGTDRIYLAAFNNGTFRAELRVVDRFSGNTALLDVLGAIDPGGTVQLPWLALEVPWVWEDPMFGTVLAGTTTNVDITFSAVVIDPLPLGTYESILRFYSNDPVVGGQGVPATMHVVSEFTAPMAGFDAGSPVCLGEGMVFTNTSTPGVPPATYLWDFGDGSDSTLEHPTHLYATAGSFTVTLEACNTQGCSYASETVEVLPLPAADFTYSVAGLAVSFNNSSTGADTYLWEFGDGMTSTLENPVHTYDTTGVYTVTLSASGDCGTDMFTDVVEATEYRIYLPLVTKSYLP
jgi:DNA-binding beta-propeller fold protein YncE